MGVGYSVSPLHCISYLEPIEGTKPQPPPSNDMVAALHKMGTVWDGTPTAFRSPSITDIIRWRNGVSEKYRYQLGEELLWDENSTFEKSEDVGTGVDVMLRYTAAVLDQRGPVNARSLVRATRPAAMVLNAVLSESKRRGFGCRFPHLLLGATYWFPFKGHLIIEEPNWRKEVERYGSLFQLGNELDEIRTVIADVDPNATAWSAEKGTPQDDVLAAAWQAGDTISRLCTIALARHLPLWTAG